MFGRKKTISRADQLARASQLAARGRNKRAASIYQELLGQTPDDVDVQRRAAPVFAKLRRWEEAWQGFSLVAGSLHESGFEDKAIGIYHEAAHFMPRRAEVWLAISEIHLEQERRSDAAKVLLEGRSHLRGRKLRGDAIQLMIRSHQIEPLSLRPTLDLARQLKRKGRKSEAIRFLEEALARIPVDRRRRIRAALFRLSPTPAALWRWIRNSPPA